MDNRIIDIQSRQIIEEQTATIRLLTDLAKAGSWVIRYSAEGRIASVQWGNGFRRLMGYTDPSDFPDEIDVFLDNIHPEDRDAFVRKMADSVFDRAVLQTEGNDFRFRRKDGSFRWYRSMGRVVREADGRPLECKGVTIDITESREHDMLFSALQNEAASLNTIHEMLGSGKWTMDFDESGAMVRVNWSDEFRRMLGYRGLEDFPDALESWSELLHPDDRDQVLSEYNATIADYSGKKPTMSNTGC